MLRWSVAAGLLSVCAAGSLVAQSTTEASYFGARNAGLTFNEYVVQISLDAKPDLEAVTTVGDVTFENALLLRAPAGAGYDISGGTLTNGYAQELDVAIRLHFVSAVSSVAFQLFAQNDFENQTNPFIEAFIGATSLGRYEITNAQTLVGLQQSEPLSWFGLENSVFDRLDIIAPVATVRPDGAPTFTQVQSVGIANIEYEKLQPAPVEVPEPASLTLLILGLSASLVGVARRSQR